MILLELAVGLAAVFFGSDFGRAAAGAAGRAGGRAGGFETAGLGGMNPFVVFDSLLTAAFTRRSRTW